MANAPSPFGVEEELWFGDPNDEQAEERARESVAAAGARIVGAKPFPLAAKKLEELTRNPKARLEQVVSVLETDPGLSARLLRLVNSAGYGLKVRVTSVRHAAVLVGTRRLHQVATTAAILDMFENDNEQALLLLGHASVVGSLCRYLAVHLGLPHDELFTCGFLHDIGKLMLLDTEGERYKALLVECGSGPDRLHPRERELYGFDHAVLGAHVLRAWNIPEPVPKVVAWHHQPARALQDSLISAMVQALRLADLLSYTLTADSDASLTLQIANSEAARYLDISEAQLAAMWEDLRALAERSRARSNGQDDLEVVAPRRLEVPRSLRPRHSLKPGRSLRPGASVLSPQLSQLSAHEPESKKSALAPRSVPVQEVPQHFPCIACNKPSFGIRCRACAAQVCPEHLVGFEQWCSLCAREYERYREKKLLPKYLKMGALALAGFSVGASLTNAFGAASLSWPQLIGGPLLTLLFWAVLLPVGYRLWLRIAFIRSRPKGRVPQPVRLPKPDPVFISSLDANLESDGLIGLSMAPAASARARVESEKGLVLSVPPAAADGAPVSASLPASGSVRASDVPDYDGPSADLGRLFNAPSPREPSPTQASETFATRVSTVSAAETRETSETLATAASRVAREDLAAQTNPLLLPRARLFQPCFEPTVFQCATKAPEQCSPVPNQGSLQPSLAASGLRRAERGGT